MQSIPQQIPVSKTLDVEAVERKLAELWEQTAGKHQSDEEAVLRARVADVMVFLNNESVLPETHQVISELAQYHPCRALVMVGDRKAAAHDILIYASAFCPSQRRSGSMQLCCEEVTFIAGGPFVSELPSASIPLLVPDLPVFLWWRDLLQTQDKIFKQLSLAAGRVVIDSADFQNPNSEFFALGEFFDRSNDEAIAISDINWARLTSWRALLANFYDVPDYRAELDQIVHVRIDYVAQHETRDPQARGAQRGSRAGVEVGSPLGVVVASAPASQAVLLAGWLAGCLGWEVKETQAALTPSGLCFEITKGGRLIKLQLNEVLRPAMKAGRLAQISLETSDARAVFFVRRSEDGLHLETQARIGERVCPDRVLPVRNRTTAVLLGREMEILGRDVVYEEAVGFGIKLLNRL